MRRWGLRLLLLLAGLWIAHAIFLRLTRIAPPSDAWARAQTMPRPLPVSAGPRTFIGENWMGRERGIWEYHLGGDALSMGYAHARLGTPLLVRTDQYMFDEMHHYVPSQAALFLIRMGVLLRYRHLLDAVTPDIRVEMTGMAVGQPDLNADFLPMFHRIVFYHALHDITQTLEQSPLLGCTAFAAMGEATAQTDARTAGHLIIGRNFDFEGPPIFDSDKAVLFFRPSEPGKLAFASVAWAGMLGVVTGLNEAGIYASVNALRTDDKGQSGVPVELLLREVMEGAHTLDEAIAIVNRRPVFVPDLYVLGDGDRREAAVIERSPTRSLVRRSRDVLAVANHALSPEYQSDRENARLRTELTSGARQARTEELLAKHRGHIDPATALAMLRDKRGVADKQLGLGNRNALDALIATHSVVVDASARLLWVGQGPHALGRYVAFDLRRELAAGPGSAPPGEGYPADLPEDPTRHSAEYRQFLDTEQALVSVDLLRRHRELDRAIDQAERAVALSPLHCDARKRLADLYYQRNQTGDRATARRHYQTFLTLSPPYLREIREAEARLAEAPAGTK
jgi:isopenicillin-N N-acyltransferase-like protein